MTGAWSPLVRGTYPPLHQPAFPRRRSAYLYVESVQDGDRLTPCTRAPLAEPPLIVDIALPFPKFASDFCLFTTIWDDPKTLDAGRFSADIFSGEVDPL